MVTLPNDPFELSILLFKNMQNRDLVAGQLSGIVSEDLNFSKIYQKLEELGSLIASDEASRTLEFYLPPLFLENINGLLVPTRRIQPPTKFYLADIDCLYKGDATQMPQVVKNYLAASEFYALLSKASDHQGGIGSAKTLIFLQKEKLELTTDYSVNDLRELTGLAEFGSDFIESNTHTEQKRTIIKTALLELFMGRCRVPFAELLDRFNDFLEKIRASYQLYVAEFSFQKIKAEIEKEKLDATVKLNKVFSDIQNQLLAVPAALILAGGQMENVNAWTSKNLLIWLGVLVFSIFMSLLIRNQRHTLIAVKQEINQQWQQIKGKHHTVADRFKTSYEDLDVRYKHQSRLLWTVDFLVAISLAVSTGLLIHYSNIFI